MTNSVMTRSWRYSRRTRRQPHWLRPLWPAKSTLKRLETQYRRSDPLPLDRSPPTPRPGNGCSLICCAMRTTRRHRALDLDATDAILCTGIIDRGLREAGIVPNVPRLPRGVSHRSWSRFRVTPLHADAGWTVIRPSRRLAPGSTLPDGIRSRLLGNAPAGMLQNQAQW